MEGALWVVALSCGLVAAESWHAAKVSAQAALAFAAEGPRTRTAAKAGMESPVSNSDAVIGALEIRALGLKVPVLANYDPSSLKRGVGHIPNTAMPGGLGNLGLAGHRDTYFRPLRNVRKGMLIEIRTAEGKFTYQINSTEVVNPEQVEVLDIRDKPELTLITCYPFEFIGAAPQRFIVHARLLSLDPA
jgi:sortase A